MILYTPHLTIALFSLCHTLSYSCFANIRFCENDLCPEPSQLALRNTEVPHFHLESLLITFLSIIFDQIFLMIQYGAS